MAYSYSFIYFVYKVLAFWGGHSVYTMPTVRWPQILLPHHLKCCGREQGLFANNQISLLLFLTVLLYLPNGAGSVLQLKNRRDHLTSEASNLLGFILEMLPYPGLLKNIFFSSDFSLF